MSASHAGGRQGRPLAAYVAFATRHAWALVLAAVAITAGSGAIAARLSLHTDVAELLPDEHPAVVALRRISGRQKASTNLALLIESPSAEANGRLAEALRGPLEAMVPRVFSEVQWRPDPDLPAYAARWRWLYADRGELERAEVLFDRLVHLRESPLLVDLDEDDPRAALTKLRQDMDARVPPPPTGDHFLAAEGGQHYLGIMLWRRGDGLASLGDHEMVRAVEQVVERAQPQRFHPQLRVEYTGPVAMSIAEHNAIRDDLALATAICTALVLLVIWIYFRRVALLVLIGAPVACGLALALAVARLTIHYLNANTAFLISIILGNGINAPIILLARYLEERRRGGAVAQALAASMGATLLGTGAAMAAAAIAYGSLLVTSFRGFSQFGLVGGTGMLLVWLATFALVPPLVVLGERHTPHWLAPEPNTVRRPFAALGVLAERRPGVLAVGTGLLLVAAAVPLLRYLHDPMEWDFRHLRSKETRAQENWGKMYRLGMGNVGAGHIATDGVVLVDDPAQADPVAEALRAQDRALGQRHILREVRTIHSVLPSDQGGKLAVLARIRAKIDRRLDLLSDDDRAAVSRLRPPDYLRPLTVDDLPRSVRESFTEVDGTRGRLVGIDAEPRNFSDLDGHDLLRLARAMRVEALGKTWVAASTGTVFGSMVETIARDAPRVTALALIGVMSLIVFAFGLRAALPVVGCLLLGVTWLGGGLALLHLKLNFVNFVGIPITLGIGTDYAANIAARMRVGPRESLVEILAETGSAVALCSLTTVIGYSSLLLASNRALQSFGLLADIGEVTCLAAALVALPALVRLRARVPSADVTTLDARPSRLPVARPRAPEDRPGTLDAS